MGDSSSSLSGPNDIVPGEVELAIEDTDGDSNRL